MKISTVIAPYWFCCCGCCCTSLVNSCDFIDSVHWLEPLFTSVIWLEMRYRHISTEFKVWSNVCNYCSQRVILFIDLAMAGTKTYGLFTECVDFVHNHKAIPIFRRWSMKTILVLYSDKYVTLFDTVIHFGFLYFPKLSLSFSLYILSFPLLSLFILLI